jgi:hypothetical protein
LTYYPNFGYAVFMQQVIEHIFETLGGPTKIATGTGFAIQTVHSWTKAPAEIPPWRRSAVLDFARRDGKLDKLSADAREYLTSTERTVGKAAA